MAVGRVSSQSCFHALIKVLPVLVGTSLNKGFNDINLDVLMFFILQMCPKSFNFLCFIKSTMMQCFLSFFTNDLVVG